MCECVINSAHVLFNLYVSILSYFLRERLCYKTSLYIESIVYVFKIARHFFIGSDNIEYNCGFIINCTVHKYTHSKDQQRNKN